MNKLLWVIVTGAMLNFGVACNYDPKIVKIVIPKNYTGPLKIKADKTLGNPVGSEEKSYTFLVDNTGSLRLSDTNVFYRWHLLKIVDSSGDVVNEYDATSEDSHSDSRYFFRYGTSNSSSTNYESTLIFFIGTKQQADKYFSSIHPSR